MGLKRRRMELKRRRIELKRRRMERYKGRGWNYVGMQQEDGYEHKGGGRRTLRRRKMNIKTEVGEHKGGVRLT